MTANFCVNVNKHLVLDVESFKFILITVVTGSYHFNRNYFKASSCVGCNISNTMFPYERMFHQDFQTPRSGLKKQGSFNEIRGVWIPDEALNISISEKIKE